MVSYKYTGNIPKEIGNRNSLEVLDMGGNQLNGPLPSEIGNMTDLYILYLWNNFLTGKSCILVFDLQSQYFSNLFTLCFRFSWDIRII